MEIIENSKLTVVGAGSVGSSVAYAALIRGSARHVALYDIATEKVEAEVLDLAHGTQFTGSSDIIGGSDISVAAGSHVVVITAGAKQKPGQTRIELAEVNAGIIRSMMPDLLEVAPNAIYVIVTNPCDVLTVIAQEETGLPPERIFASGTVLDTSRLRWKLAQRAGVSTASGEADGEVEGEGTATEALATGGGGAAQPTSHRAKNQRINTPARSRLDAGPPVAAGKGTRWQNPGCGFWPAVSPARFWDGPKVTSPKKPAHPLSHPKKNQKNPRIRAHHRSWRISFRRSRSRIVKPWTRWRAKTGKNWPPARSPRPCKGWWSTKSISTRSAL